MKPKQELQAALESWLQAHYYDEDYELAGAFAGFQQDLCEEERAVLRTVITERFAADPSLVDAMLAAQTQAREAAPLLVEHLQRETDAGMMARTLIHALAALEHADAFDAIERFLESDLEMEVILCLARLDFERTLPVLLRVESRPHVHKACLQALHEVRARRGMDALIAALRTAVGNVPDACTALERILRSSDRDHNPFTTEEIGRLIRAGAPG